MMIVYSLQVTMDVEIRRRREYSNKKTVLLKSIL